MRHGLYLHPRDLDAASGPGAGAAGLAGLGFGDLAMAAAYHAGRWLTPRGDSGLVRFLEDGIVHFRPGACYDGLQPLASREVAGDGPSPLQRFVADSAAAQVDSYAWTVCFHNSRLGAMHPESCVRNAFGDVYEYALCPARDEVAAYGLRLATDIASHGVDVLELEAIGWMGHKHGSHHDKASFKPDRLLDFLLSYCFCDVCLAGVARHGGDAAAARAAARAEIQRQLIDGDAMRPRPTRRDDVETELERVLGEGQLLGMLRHRRAVYRELLGTLRRAVPDAVRLALHVRPDPLFTGSQLGVTLADAAALADEIIVTHYGEGPDRIAADWRDRAATGAARVRIAIWPKAPEFGGEEDVRQVLELAGERGCDGLRIYHASLLPQRTLEAVAGVLEEP